jgi:hypothetical protein
VGANIRVILKERESVSCIENQSATGSRRSPDSLQAAIDLLEARRFDPAFAMPSGSVYGEALLKARDAVRLKKDLDIAPSGSEGVILGWYANEPRT